MSSDVMNMQAGPELDALVAEKVMGWKLHKEGRAWKWWDIPLISPHHEQYDGHDDQPPYSTDPAAAWEVVEKMRERWSVYVNALDDPRECGCVVGKTWREPEAAAIGPTMPVAVCRCAVLLAARGAGREGQGA